MKKILVAAFLASLASPALACTVEDVQKKSEAFTEKVQQLAATDPGRVLDLNRKVQDGQSRFANDPDAACKFYDELLAELEQGQK